LPAITAIKIETTLMSLIVHSLIHNLHTCFLTLASKCLWRHTSSLEEGMYDQRHGNYIKILEPASPTLVIKLSCS